MATTTFGGVTQLPATGNYLTILQTIIEQLAALAAGYLEKNVAGSTATTTLTLTESQNKYFRFHGARTAVGDIIVSPSGARLFSAFNDGTGQTLTIKVTPGGVGVAVATTARKLLVHNGVDVYEL